MQTCTLGRPDHFHFLGSKGADVTLDLMCLDFFLKLRLRDPKDGVKKLLSAMQQLTQGLLTFLGIMRSHVLWLLLGCCGLTWKEGLKTLRCYSFGAKKAKEKQKKSMRPKFHSLAHTMFELKGSHETAQPHMLNPCAFNCQQMRILLVEYHA